MENPTNSTPDKLPETETPPTVIPQQPAMTTPAPTTTNGLAVASLVVGIVAFFSGWIPFWGVLVGVAAVILGIFGLKKGTQKGMSIAGLVTGGLGLLWSLIVTAFVIISIISAGAFLSETPRQYDTDKNNQPQYESPSDKPMNMSKTATFGGYTVSLNSIAHDSRPTGVDIPEGMEYVVVNLTIRNKQSLSETFDTSTLILAADDTKAPVSRVTVDPDLGEMEIPIGQSASGNFVFLIPKDADMIMLEYTQTTINGTTGKQTTKKSSIHVE